ncbi:MAG: hypothetical protein ACE5H2_00190 [Terriglobia bacterium]
MIPRYTRPQMGRIWTEENKLGKWLEVELATCEALGDCGQIPKEAATTLRSTAEVPSPQRVAEIEKEVRHDVIAFTMAVNEKLPASLRGYLHYGLLFAAAPGLAIRSRCD